MDTTVITAQLTSGSVVLGATVGTGVAVGSGAGTDVTHGIGEDGRMPDRGSVTAGGRTPGGRTSSGTPDRSGGRLDSARASLSVPNCPWPGFPGAAALGTPVGSAGLLGANTFVPGIGFGSAG